MSREELVAAYLDGRMSRRTLVRRLAAGGLSVGAAIAYAHLLEPSAAGARLLRSVHFDGSVRIRDSELGVVIAEKGLEVRATADRELTMFLEVYLRRPDHPKYPRSLLGSSSYEFPAAGSLTERIYFDANPPFSLKAVKKERRKRGKARFEVIAVGNPPDAAWSTFVDLRKIRDP